jgi:hypothetical protein
MKYLRDVPGGTDSASRRRIRISGIVPIREGAHGDDAHGDDSRQCRRSRKLARMLRQMNGWAEMQRQGSTLTPKRAVLILDSQLKVKEST